MKRGARLAKKYITKLVKSNKIININTVEYWDSVWRNEGLEARKASRRNSKIIELIPDGSAIMDVGCGNGQLLRQLLIKKPNCKCTGLDFSDALFSKLQPLGIRTIKSNLPALPVEDSSYDVVVSSETFEHIEKYEETLIQMFRITKTGGAIIITVPDGCVWGKGGEHINEFTPSDLVNIMRPFLDEIILHSFISDGYPYLLIYGKKAAIPLQYEKKYFSKFNKQIESVYEKYHIVF